MMKHLIIIILGMTVFSANGQSLWKKSNIDQYRSAPDEDKLVIPAAYHAYELDFEGIVSELYNAPKENLDSRSEQGLEISLPVANGGFETFEVYYAPVMAPKLAEKYSTIRSYKGYSTSDSGKNIRLDVGPYGLHAAIHGVDGIEYIDPYAKGNKDQYLVYDVTDQLSQLEHSVPKCGTVDDLKDIHFEDAIQTRSVDGEIPLRVYRIAIACTGEWGAVRGTVENAMADIVTGVNRINQIFENEISMRVILIENNDLLLNFDGASDPYINSQSGQAMLNVNTSVINNRVGNDAYDLGHVYGRSCDTGGIAALSSMCNNGNKGGAVTCHYSNNLDFMAANVTSHEIGHQMSAQHTFNNCNGNESLGNGYEPGSGTSIMSYSGLCGGSLNLNDGGGIYFHVASLMQIYNHTRDGGVADGCAEIIETSNVEPVISLSYEDNFTIPEDTYFVLEGSATDANENDILTYQWDGFNAGPQSPLGSPISTAPRFRSFVPRAEPFRFFPDPAIILSGTTDRREVMPEGNMDLNFMFTARDNNLEAGTAVYQEIRFKTRATNEKFEITSQSSGAASYKYGDPIDVTWNVAGTDQAPVNAPNVDIYFFAGNADNFSFDNMELLAEGIPNTGSARVYAPDMITFDGRRIVKASNSIFFSINRNNIRIEETDSETVFFTPSPVSQAVCLPNSTTVDISTQGFSGITGDVELSVVSGLPDGATAEFIPSTVPVGESSVLTIDYDGSTPSERFDVIINANVDGKDDFEREIILFVSNTDHSAMAGINPIDGASGVNVAPIFTWSESPNADSYTIEIATSPAFGNTTVIRESNLINPSYAVSDLLEETKVYYWRIIPTNVCEEGEPSSINAFSTEALACVEFSPAESSLPINISQSGSPTITSEVTVTGGSIADVNVTELTGQHENNKDLVVTLISPAGTEVVLFSKICNQSNFNCTFDDNSNTPVQCPLNAGGLTYRPKEMLDAFNEEQANGVWKLQVDDTSAGSGGSLNSFKLEVCSAQSVESPFLVNNNKIILPWVDTKVITPDDLMVDDNNNVASDLVYTVVKLPRGQIKYNTFPFSVGDQFTQADIDNGNINYASGTSNYETEFLFTVIDGEGGFLGISSLDIEVSDPNSTSDAGVANEISVYPIPATDKLTIDLSKSSEVFTAYNLVSINGQVVSSGKIDATALSVDISTLPSGVYFINIKNEEYSIPKRIVVE